MAVVSSSSAFAVSSSARLAPDSSIWITSSNQFAAIQQLLTMGGGYKSKCSSCCSRCCCCNSKLLQFMSRGRGPSTSHAIAAASGRGESKFKSVQERRNWPGLAARSVDNPSAAAVSRPAPQQLIKDLANSGSSEYNKGWTDENGVEDSRLVAQLRNIALAAEDRKEMHAIIGVQRDNWNKLCHTTVNMTTIAAAILAAMNSSFSMSVAAFLLNSSAAGFMFLASKYQPSQLAEEQRTAARFHKLLARDIHNTLLIDPRLRKNAHLYMKEVMAKLEALELAFPLPLKPNGLEKFPKTVTPSILGPKANLSKTEVLPTADANNNSTNGWTQTREEDLKLTAEKLKSSDIQIYLQQARNKELANKTLAILAPVLTATAALLSLLTACNCNWPATASTNTTTKLGIHLLPLANLISSICSIAAVGCSSFSNGGQIGMIFELYRNCAGYYEEMEQEIQTTIRLPVSQREHGELFHQKIALQLGRHDCIPLFSSQERKIGKLF